MTILRILLVCIMAGTGACSPQMRHVDIDAGGYESGPLTGRELLRSAMNHAVLATTPFGDIEMLIQKADLPEHEKTRIRQRVDFLLTTILESRSMASDYLDPVFSEADRRQVFRAVQDRVEKANQELLALKFSLRRATNTSEAAEADEE